MYNAVTLNLRKSKSTVSLLDIYMKLLKHLFIVIIVVSLTLYFSVYLISKILSTNCIFEGGAIEIAIHGPYCLEKGNIQNIEEKQNAFSNELNSFIGLNINNIDQYLLSIGFTHKENSINLSGDPEYRNLKYSEYRYQENHMLRSPTYWQVGVFSDSASDLVKSIKVKFF